MSSPGDPSYDVQPPLDALPDSYFADRNNDVAVDEKEADADVEASRWIDRPAAAFGVGVAAVAVCVAVGAGGVAIKRGMDSAPRPTFEDDPTEQVAEEPPQAEVPGSKLPKVEDTPRAPIFGDGFPDVALRGPSHSYEDSYSKLGGKELVTIDCEFKEEELNFGDSLIGRAYDSYPFDIPSYLQPQFELMVVDMNVAEGFAEWPIDSGGPLDIATLQPGSPIALPVYCEKTDTFIRSDGSQTPIGQSIFAGPEDSSGTELRQWTLQDDGSYEFTRSRLTARIATEDASEE